MHVFSLKQADRRDIWKKEREVLRGVLNTSYVCMYVCMYVSIYTFLLFVSHIDFFLLLAGAPDGCGFRNWVWWPNTFESHVLVAAVQRALKEVGSWID